MNVGVGVGGVALPLLRSVVFSYHASCFYLITRCWLLLRECHRHMWEFTTQERNVAMSHSRSGDQCWRWRWRWRCRSATIAQRRRFLPRVVFPYHASSFLTTRCWLLLRECHRHMWEIYSTRTQWQAVTIAQR